MKSFAMIALMLLLAVGVSLIPGCSSTTPTNPSMGDTNSVQFQIVQNVVADNSLEGVGNVIDISWTLFDSIPGVTASPKNFNQSAALANGIVAVDSFNYSYVNGWHIFAFWVWAADTVTYDTVSVSGIDSLQALNGTVPLQIPDSTTDALHIRAHYDVILRNTNIVGSADDSVVIDNIDWSGVNPLIIDGSLTETFTGTFADSQMVIDVNFTNTLTADSLVAIPGSEDCPSTGLLVASASIDISAVTTIGAAVDTVAIQGNWSISAAFNNGNVTMTYFDGTTYWQTTEACGTPAASPIERWVPVLD